MSVILITGSGSGLGAELYAALSKAGHDCYGYDIDVHGPDADVCKPNLEMIPEDLDVLINCAGVNKIGWLENFREEDWDTVMDTNAKGIFMMAKACRERLADSRGTIVNIVSNAAHMPMRCSAAYNASKGAALILSKQLARELIGDGITVFSVSPNKLKNTGMSRAIDLQVVETRGWTLKQAQDYQMQGLLTGQETDPVAVAEFIAYLLTNKEHHKALAGCDLQYGL